MPGLIGKDKLEKERQEFEKKLNDDKSGFVILDQGTEYNPIPFYGRTVSKDLLKFFDDKIRRHYGVSEEILNGKYTSEDKEAFYETVIESGAISLGQAIERVMLTPFARKNGNSIICYTSEIQMMSADKKLKLAELLLPTGGVTNNQVLGWFGEQPYEGGDERFMSLNYIKTKDASKYQVGEQNNQDDSVSNSE